MSLHVPSRMKNSRLLSDEHQKAIRALVAAEQSVSTVAKRLGMGIETVQCAMTPGSPFRPDTADRIERAIDVARGKVAA